MLLIALAASSLCAAAISSRIQDIARIVISRAILSRASGDSFDSSSTPLTAS